MRKAFFSAFPIALLLLPMFAHTSFFLPSTTLPLRGEFSTSAASSAAESEEVSRIHARIEEAKKLLVRQGEPTSDDVRIAAADPTSSELHSLTLPKEAFLTKDAEVTVNLSGDRTARLRVVRANGVNTAVTIFDEQGRSLAPLVVQYPIRRPDESETAYYSSVHPALESAELARDGRDYIHRMLDLAAERLRQRGATIEPGVIDAAERLCIVEHTDHKRFMNEDRGALFNEIATLYSLNSRNTYRYSVSSAGAGGMIQMIPSTYKMIRELHPRADLHPDFVTGMRDHANALEAMLLYMQGTWNDLLRQEEIKSALSSQLATREELLAAGYNSNPARLAGYIKRGGSEWRSLIPSETQMYLRIYASVDSLVPMNARS
ncbi:MAG TPA: hypothetical protein VE842_13795 [Pyrinomonadaceae bacterium]|jgi:hypothetical protein|nr:hypothetical protein [Pyrinomonadaceae bacterium]